MTWDPGKYVKLTLNREEGKKDKWLIALRTTADYYGWTKEFPIWTPKPVAVVGDYTFVMDTGRKGRMYMEGGRKHRICRSPKTSGMPKGMCNQFKVSANVGNFDLAELAHFTDIEWHWLESPFGERISRERWERYYQAINP